jgi:hypothetical protein
MQHCFAKYQARRADPIQGTDREKDQAVYWFRQGTEWKEKGWMEVNRNEVDIRADGNGEEGEGRRESANGKTSSVLAVAAHDVVVLTGVGTDKRRLGGGNKRKRKHLIMAHKYENQ